MGRTKRTAPDLLQHPFPESGLARLFRDLKSGWMDGWMDESGL